jgi:hypothetical protein
MQSTAASALYTWGRNCNFYFVGGDSTQVDPPAGESYHAGKENNIIHLLKIMIANRTAERKKYIKKNTSSLALTKEKSLLY